jgi:hypothetical protein
MSGWTFSAREGAMFLLLILCLLFGCLIVVPLMLVGLVLRLAIGIALIPLRIAGFAVKLVLSLSLGLVALVVLGALLFIPLLPVMLLALTVWLMVRMLRRQPGARLATD